MEIFIHLGQPKTGSSSIQKFLLQSNENENNADFFYPKAGRKKGDSTAHYELHEEMVAFVSDKENRLIELLGEVEQECSLSQTTQAIISCEMFAYIKNEIVWSNVKKIFHQHKIQFVFFSRDYEPWIRSWYFQGLKIGSFSGTLQDFKNQEPANFDSTINTISKVFTSEKIHILKYENVRHNLLEIFISTVKGTEESSSLGLNDLHENKTPDLRRLAFFKNLNSLSLDTRARNEIANIFSLPLAKDANSMTNIDKLIGIYSFPKSGNTWMRHVLKHGFGLHGIEYIPDTHTSSALDFVFNHQNKSYVVYKSHRKEEANRVLGFQRTNDAILYIVRHPLDVFLSQLNFLANVAKTNKFKLPIEAIDFADDETLELFFSAFTVFGTVQPFFQDAGSWFDHTAYWSHLARKEPNRVFMVRYEDLLLDGPAAIANFASAIGIESSLQTAFSSAEEDTKLDGKFYWKKKAENYKEMLKPRLIEKFYSVHSKRLEPLGY